MSVALRQRAQPWWAAALALALGTLALGAALILPQTFSDPIGLDPYTIRLSLTAALLLGVSLLRRRLAETRPVLLALVAVAVPYTLLGALPQLIVDVAGSHAPGDAALQLWGSLAQALATLLLALLAVRLLPEQRRPRLRLRRLTPAGAALALAGVAVVILAALALPASLLGRDALQPAAMARDLPWLGPANVLQAFSQELQFRGLLMGALERVMGRGWANLAQACFFGLSHLAIGYGGPVAPFVPATIAVGLLLGWLVQRTGSLWPAVIVHAAADIGLTVAVVPGLYGF